LQKRTGRFSSSIVICAHISPVKRPGVLPRMLPPACVTASGVTNVSGEVPSGRSIATSSATRSPVTRRVPVSRSRAKMRTGTVLGSGPVRPATAVSASLETVPRSCPSEASL
jgi:hypothetical protein